MGGFFRSLVDLLLEQGILIEGGGGGWSFFIPSHSNTSR